MSEQQIAEAKKALAEIETKDNKSVAEWAMQYVVPYLEEN